MENENEEKETGNWEIKPTPSPSQEGNILEPTSNLSREGNVEGHSQEGNMKVSSGEGLECVVNSKKSVLKKIAWGIVALILVIALVQVAVADRYQAQVLVIEGEGKVGVNPTTDKLDFGDLSGDTSAARYVTLRSGGMDTYIAVWKFGSIAELIKLSDNNFTMEKGDEKRLEMSVYMPLSAPVDKKYTGQVWIFKIPKVW